MKSVIMAGGEGTRLRPLTANQPKPMLPLGNRPMMEHIVRHVHNHGFKDIVVTVQFLASQVRNYFGDGSDMGVDLTYATETTPLGTAGSVRNAAEQLHDTFLVISGDALTDVDLGELVAFHRRSGAMGTVALKHMDNPLEFGIVITREDGRIERFLEKPHWGQVFSDTINTGIYVLEPEVFDHIPDGPSDFAGDIFPKLLELGAPLYGFVVDGYWEDVGNLEAYQKAHQDILDGRVKVDIGGFEVRPGVWLGEGAEVDPDARLDGPVLIGDFAKVERDVHLREYSVIGSGVVVKSGAFLDRVVVRDNAYIGHGAILQPNVKIYPFKTVEPGATVTKSIIWEGRGARSLFDEHGVSGLANVDVTPELALRVAMAFGSTLRKGSRVTLGRDASRVSRAFKRALVAGLNATGVTCADLELAPAPAVRFSATKAGTSGGVYVRTSPRDSQSIELAIFADDGCDLDEGARRKLERTYNREEFRRAFGREMGARSDEPGDIALPVSTTRWAAELAAKHGRAVVGTKLAARAVARAAQRDGVVFAGAEGGGYVFPSLHPAYDGLLAFGKLLELLATEETGLSKAVAALPEVGLVRRQIPTPWGRKGAIMRQIVEAAKQRPTDDTDGIKVFHPPKGGSGASRPDDWVLVIPDTVEPVTHLWAESATVADADELADAYEALVRRAAEGE